jgi:hypothetical protein
MTKFSESEEEKNENFDDLSEFSEDDSDNEGDESESSPSISMDKDGVIKVGKKDYAIGLFWNTADDINELSSEARKAAKSESLKAEFYCVRDENIPQYGLGFKSKGHKSGMPSLGSHLAETLDGNWIGVFNIGDVYYLISVRDDIIMSDTDIIFKSEDDVREEFENNFYGSSWDKAFAPSYWELENTEHKKLEDILVGNPTTKLKEADQSKVLIKLVLMVVLFGGFIFGSLQAYNYFNQDTAIEKVTEIYNEVETRVVEQTGGNQEDEVYVPEPPWVNKPLGIASLSACFNDINNMSINVPGWEAKGMICTPGASTSMLLERSGGTINWIGNYLNGKGAIDPNIIPIDDDRVEVGYPSTVTSDYPEQLDTFPVSQIRRYLYSHFDEAYLDISFSDVRKFSDPEAYRFYKGLEFEFSSEYNPTKFTKILSRVPGFIINRIEYKIVDDKWTVSGEVYEERLTPLPPQQN